MSQVAGSPGILVAVEGIDGAGKSTQVARVAEALAREGYEVVRTHEPTDGPHGRRLRASATTGRLAPDDELETFIADRREHVRELIAPSIAAGKVVLVDRYYFSSMAYQGARGLDPAEIQRRNEEIAPRPDLLVILEIDARDGVARVNSRGKGNLFEREDDLRRSAKIFDAITAPTPLRLDATRAPEEITARILAALRPLLAR
jgi:dTMP kinase